MRPGPRQARLKSPNFSLQDERGQHLLREVVQDDMAACMAWSVNQLHICTPIWQAPRPRACQLDLALPAGNHFLSTCHLTPFNNLHGSGAMLNWQHARFRSVGHDTDQDAAHQVSNRIQAFFDARLQQSRCRLGIVLLAAVQYEAAGLASTPIMRLCSRKMKNVQIVEILALSCHLSRGTRGLLAGVCFQLMDDALTTQMGLPLDMVSHVISMCQEHVLRSAQRLQKAHAFNEEWIWSC